MHSSSRSSSLSPKSPFTKKKRFFDSTYSNDSQSDSLVCWKNSQEFVVSSPVTASKHKSANQLVQTPVRIVKRHASSPLLTNGKCDRSRVKDLSRFENQLGKVTEAQEEEQKPGPSKTRTREKLDDSFDLSSDEYKFDLGDEELLLAIKDIEENEKKERLTQEIKERTKVNKDEQPQAKPKLITSGFTLDFDDSFDDTIFNSIPLEEISRKSAKEKITNVDIKFDPESGLSQIVPSSSKVLPRCSSDSRFPKKESTFDSKTKSNISFPRHKSLLNPKPHSSPLNQEKIATTITSTSKKIFTTHTFCSPEEIAAKKRQAQERLAATKLKENLKKSRR